MMQNKTWTEETKKERLNELKEWLDSVKNEPAEGMADFFAHRIDTYENVHLSHWGEIYAGIADFLPENISTLLDIGCGTGLELEAIFKRYPDLSVTGIDLSETMLGKLKEKFPDKDLKIIQADYFEYPFEKERFDSALSFETLHHFSFKKKQEIYRKLKESLNDGGSYIECDYVACCIEEEEMCMKEYEERRKTNNIPDDVFVHIDIPLTMEHQIELMQNAGFRKVQVVYQNESTVIFKADK